MRNDIARVAPNALAAVRVARYRARHPERVKAAQQRYDATRDHAARSKLWRQRNDAKRLKYNQDTADRRAAQQNKRRALKLQAMPVWANEERIREIYSLAQLMGQDVDHIIPLCSERVCGLHVEANLQLLDQLENRRKKNIRWPDMFEEPSDL